jgi:hypothetical protein
VACHLSWLLAAGSLLLAGTVADPTSIEELRIEEFRNYWYSVD